MIPIETIPMSGRLYNILRNNGIGTLEDATKLNRRSFLGFRSTGKKSLAELNEILLNNGLSEIPDLCPVCLQPWPAKEIKK